MIKLINKFMAKLKAKRFVPTQEEMEQGEQPMDKTEILEALIAYKKQNPVKYAAKKAALFKKYGLNLDDEPVELQDEEEQELEAIKEKVAKKAVKKKAK